jgi:hypothetical protein
VGRLKTLCENEGNGGNARENKVAKIFEDCETPSQKAFRRLKMKSVKK